MFCPPPVCGCKILINFSVRLKYKANIVGDRVAAFGNLQVVTVNVRRPLQVCGYLTVNLVVNIFEHNIIVKLLMKHPMAHWPIYTAACSLVTRCVQEMFLE